MRTSRMRDSGERSQSMAASASGFPIRWYIREDCGLHVPGMDRRNVRRSAGAAAAIAHRKTSGVWVAASNAA